MPNVNPGTIRDLLKFQMFEKGQHESTCIADVTYDPEVQEMVVAFVKRGTYKYFDVPLEEYTNLSLAGSQGTYFNLYIRLQFRYERVG